MTRVLFVYDGKTSSVELVRAFGELFSRKHGNTFRMLAATEVTPEDIQNCDIVECIRGESPLTCEILKQARKAGRFIIFQLDDDLQHLPKGSFRYPGRKKYLLKGLRYADLFLTTNRLLAEEYLPLIAGDRAVISETTVQEEQIQPRIPKADTETVRIVYAASGAHVGHWNKYIAPVWPKLAEKYGDKISLTFVGLRPDMPEQTSGAKVEFVPPMNLADYRAYMYAQHFDIGLSPLDTDHFNARKYYNKFLEYAMCGICGVYSNCSPYDQVVKDGENGFLVESTPEDWEKALEKVIDEKVLRETCVDNSQALLRERFAQDKIDDHLIRDVPEILSFRAPDHCAVRISPVAKLEYRLFRMVESLYLTGLSMKLYGWKKTLDRVKNKLKR